MRPSTVNATRAFRQLLIVVSLIIAFCFSAATAKAQLVIAEIYGGGGNSSATYSNDFVVVFNPTGSDVDVNGWSVQYGSGTGTGNWAVAPLATTSTIIPPGGYFLLRMASQAAVGGSIGTPDAISTINMSGSTGKVALCNNTTALNGACPSSESIVDLVGFGTANCSEGSLAAGAPNNASSIRRKDGGCLDTNNNATDFETSSPPTPRNSSSPTQSCNLNVAPAITSHPLSRTNNAGTTATFTVVATGTGLSYTWQKNGGSITEENVLGINGATLTITNVSAANAGSYNVVVANTVGSVTSDAATLTVLDPAINTQPTSRTNLIGDTANFFVGAGGFELTYQWQKDGVNIPDGTDAALNVVNVQPSDAGNYYAIVANSLGNSATSSVVTLTVATTPSTRIARWNFNGNGKSTTEPGPSEVLTAASASLIGGATGAWAGGSFADPGQVEGLINDGWNTAGYPAASADNKTRGVQFNVSTEGYQDVVLAWEQRHSNTASKYTRVQYSLDGSTFIDGPVLAMGSTNNSFVLNVVNLSNIAGLNNNPNASFRMVTEFESTATGSGSDSYVGTVGNYGTGGTIRYDIVSVYGNVLGTISPTPVNVALDGTDVVLTWSNPAFVLQSANEVNGTYTDIQGATSPYRTPVSGARKFYRLKH